MGFYEMSIIIRGECASAGMGCYRFILHETSTWNCFIFAYFLSLTFPGKLFPY